MITLARERGPLWEQMRDRGVDTYSLGLKRINLRSVPVAAFRLRRVIRSLDPDVVHCLLFYASLATELALLGMRQPPSLLVRHHNLLLHIQEKRLHVWADSWMARRASKVVAVSEAVRGTLVREGVPRSHVKVIHNGLDWEGAVRTQREAMDAWRARFQPQVLLVAAGRLTFQKDYPTLLRAFSLLREEHPQTHLVIAGTGSEQEHETMLALLKQNRIEDAVTLAGWIPDVYSLMAAADIFVHAALEEAFCQAVVEAAGLGVPVVSTSAGAVPEILGEIHVPLPTRDASTLAARLSDTIIELDRAKTRAGKRGAYPRTLYGRTDGSAVSGGIPRRGDTTRAKRSSCY